MISRSATLERVLPWVLITLATLFVYYPVIHGGLIMDDAEHITPHSLQSLAGLGRIWFEVGATPHYYPVLNSAFWCEHVLWGESAVGYHGVNLMQHTVAACLVVLLVRRLGLPGATLAGLIFAVHPVQVESVAWISEQKNTLSTLFGLGAVLVYFKFQDARRPSLYVLASGLFLFALLTKTVVAVIPPALLVVAWWRSGRIDWKRDVVPMLPWLIAGAILGLFSAWFERIYSHATGAAFQLSATERALIAGRAVCFYVRTLIWPVDLMYINPRWAMDTGTPLDYGWLALVLLGGGLLVVVARRWRGPLAAFLLFVGMLFPVLGFLNINWFNFSYVADHFQYLPSLGLIVPFAAGTTWALRRLTRGTAVALAVKSLLMLALVGAARFHAEDYRAPEILYARTLEKNPGCWLAHNNLGVLQLDDPARLAEATAHFERALQLKPDHARAHHNYGTALLRANRLDEAIAHYRRALELQSSTAETHFNLGEALLLSGDRVDDAIAEFDEAIRLKRDYADAYAARADALARQSGGGDEAIAAYREALALAPERAELHQGLAVALLAMPGKRGESLAQFREAVRLKPDFAEAYNNLGSALSADASTLTEAVDALTRATQLAPDYADARFNLGVLLAGQPGRRSEGLVQLREAVRLNPGDVEVRTALASILAQRREDLPEAAAQLGAVVGLRTTDAQAHVNLASVLARIPGRGDEARDHYRRALAIEPDNGAARAGLSVVGGPR